MGFEDATCEDLVGYSDFCDPASSTAVAQLCSSSVIVGEIEKFKGFKKASNSQAMGFTLTNDEST